ncbi:MAG: hypothetical protein HKO59_03150, partial [Phycisphaerales bacterium]|nr:hypothetical protein [Phycisphaerales bacterium]
IPAHQAAIIILSNTIVNGDFRADDAALDAFAVMNGQPVTLPPPGVAHSRERLDTCTGRYVLDGGAVVEVVRRGRDIAIVTGNSDASRIVTFPEAYAAEPAAIAPDLDDLLGDMAADDYDRVREASWAGIPFERLRERYRQWWRASTEQLGELRSAGLAHEVTREMDRETEIFIGLQFERGVRVIRARRNASGKYLFDVPDEHRLELSHMRSPRPVHLQA